MQHSLHIALVDLPAFERLEYFADGISAQRDAQQFQPILDGNRRRPSRYCRPEDREEDGSERTGDQNGDEVSDGFLLEELTQSPFGLFLQFGCQGHPTTVIGRIGRHVLDAPFTWFGARYSW